MPINKWMDQQTVISVKGKTQQKKKNKTIDTCNNMDESQIMLNEKSQAEK